MRDLIDRLWAAPPRVTIRVPAMNPETDRQRVHPITGERLWVREDVNAIMYYGAVILMIPYMLVWVVIHEIRLSYSESYRSEYLGDMESHTRRRQGQSDDT